jgi:ATP-dependent Clp protease protease subunit
MIVNIFLLMFLGLMSTFFYFPVKSQDTSKDYSKLVEVNSRNLVTIRGPIQSDTVTDFLHKTSNIDSDEIFIYISSPGGSVMEGLKIVDVIKSLEKSGIKINCISDFSASMAFIILQACPNRMATYSSVLMQHQMSLGLKGNIENIDNYLKFIRDIDDDLDKLQSDKIGISKEEFKRKITNDWWINGPNAKEKSVVDELVLVTCHKELDNKYEALVINFGFNQVHLIYSMCPLSRYPVQVLYNGIDVDMLDSKIKKSKSYYEITNNITKWLNYDEPIFGLSY